MHASPLDHVKWFADPAPYPTRYDLLLSPPVLAALAIAGLAMLLAALYERRFPEPRRVKWLERFAAQAPAALGIHLGIALLIASLVGILFVPALRIPSDTAIGFAILTVQAMCGLMVLLGVATRVAAVLLALLGILAMSLGGLSPESILEQIHILGIAVFLFLVGRGRWSLDRLRNVRPPLHGAEIPAAALSVLRVALGFAVFYSALTEKLLNPALAQSLIDERPWLNAGRIIGLADGQFVFLAGLTELVIGAVVMSPWVTRPVATLGAVIFTASLPFFGWSELLGHLPFYGIFLVLLIAPKADSLRVRRALSAVPQGSRGEPDGSSDTK